MPTQHRGLPAAFLPPKETNKKKKTYSCFLCHDGVEARWADVTHGWLIFGGRRTQGWVTAWRGVRAHLSSSSHRGLWWQLPIGSHRAHSSSFSNCACRPHRAPAPRGKDGSGPGICAHSSLFSVQRGHWRKRRWVRPRLFFDDTSAVVKLTSRVLKTSVLASFRSFLSVLWWWGPLFSLFTAVYF